MIWVEPTCSESHVAEDRHDPVRRPQISTLLKKGVVNFYQNSVATGVSQALAKSPENVFFKPLDVNFYYGRFWLAVKHYSGAGYDMDFLTFHGYGCLR